MTDALTSTLQAAKRIILSVGSGDGSQQVSIVQLGHPNLITTFFDSEKTVNSKYKSSREHIALLRKTSRVLFGVNATKLHQHPDLKDEKFNIILFSFPHTGAPNYTHGHRGPNPKSIEGNKQLIREFLSSAQHILATDGQIYITLKTSSPYEQWTFPDFAKYEIEPKSQQDFNSQLFPGYTHQSTKGIGSVRNGKAKTYIFGKKNKHQDDSGEEKGAFSPTSSFTLSIEFAAVSDGDIETIVMNILSMSKHQTTLLNVLDIRRQISEAVRPDTRQLNRVLYQMEKSNKLRRGSPKGSSQKPTWILAA